MAIALYPAVDVLGGKAVRLEQGDYDRSTHYDADPLDAARRWVEGGAQRLHVVDLDGAREGAPVNLESLRSIASQLGVPVQYGGGLRSVAAARSAIEAGAARVVLGTVAFKSLEVLEEALATFGNRVAVSVDVRKGRVATEGWIEQTELKADDAIIRLREAGVATFIYTNVELDGTLAGIDPSEVEAIGEAVGDGALIWSGGIGSIADLELLARSAPPNLGAVIVGKALYENRFTVAQALEALA